MLQPKLEIKYGTTYIVTYKNQIRLEIQLEQRDRLLSLFSDNFISYLNSLMEHILDSTDEAEVVFNVFSEHVEIRVRLL